MSLFENGTFRSTSGVNLPFKIDCDFLTDTDIETLAIQCALHYPAYAYTSVPTGGNRFTSHLDKYVKRFGMTDRATFHYIVDDVWTTGKSVLEIAIQNNLFSELGKKVRCLVIFARGPYPSWVTPLFELNKGLQPWTKIWKE